MNINRYFLSFVCLMGFLFMMPLKVSAQEGMSEDDIMKYYLAGFLLLVIVTFFLIIRLNRTKSKDEEAVKTKITNLRASGQELHVHRTEPLTEEDVQFLQKYLNTTLMVIAVVMGVIALLFFFLGDGFFKLIGIGVIALIFPARKYTKQGIERVLHEGKKLVIRGIVTERFTTTSGSSKSRTTHYWLNIGEVRFEVTSKRYNAYTIGDAAEFHAVDYPKGKFLILSDTKLEGAGIR